MIFRLRQAKTVFHSHRDMGATIKQAILELFKNIANKARCQSDFDVITNLPPEIRELLWN